MSKYSTPFRQTMLCFFFFMLLCSGRAQNLAPNHDFESFTNCPPGFGGGGPLQCTPWQSGTTGSTDYLHECANPTLVGVPQNFFGNQAAHSGQAYTGGYFRLSGFEYREYLQGPLTEPMVAGKNYVISFYVSLADLYCGIEDIGVYLSASPPGFGGFGPLDVTPQVVNTLGFIGDNEGWTLISGCYFAQGGEAWVTIGNFDNDANTPLDPNCTFTLSSYYYIDDVVIEEGPPGGDITVDIGDFEVACDSTIIDPMIPDAFFTWSDGSHGETLEVTESGVYALTVTDGCAVGIDSVAIEIVGSANVDIGPATLNLCDGDTYEISLDPDAGTYTWLDGSEGPDYTISTGGLHQVTLDDGCDFSTDAIQVTILYPPEPFTLGPDTYMCPDDEIEIDFDPSLGTFNWQDNSSSSSYIITTGGVYSLTISNACGQVSDDLEINVIEPPEFTLGPDELVLCAGQTLDLEFDPDMGAYIWQDGSDLNTYLISEAGYYALTVTNECGSLSQDMVVTVLDQPVVELGDDLVLCPGQLPYILDVGVIPTVFSYVWQDGSNGNDFEVLIPGAYSITVSNECFSATDDILITIEDAVPVVDLPDDQMLCPGQDFVLSTFGVPGTYLWQDGSTGDEYIVTAPGTYSLTITNDCGSGVDSITIDYMAAIATPDLGADVSLCPGEQYTFYANVPGANYTWQDGSTADSLLVSGAGTYSLQVANMCSAASDTVIVTVDASPPSVDLPSTLSLCQGDTVVIASGISGVDFLWNNGSQNSSLTVFSPGTYSLLVTNSCGADTDTTVVSDAGDDPVVSLGADVSLCQGDAVVLTPVSTGVNTWLWQDGSTAPDFTITQAGVVFAKVTNDCGQDADTLLVSFLPDAPVIDLGGDTSLCPGESFDLAVPLTGVNILWSDGSGANTLSVSSSGTYYVDVSNSCGGDTDTVVVGALPAIPSLDLGPDQSLCPGEIINISPSVTGVQYLWQDGSTASSFTATQAGDVILIISNACGQNTDTLSIIENNQGPQVDLGADVLACEGDVVTLSAGVLGVSYLWQDGSTAENLDATVSGTYILNVSNACGSDADTVVVDIHGTVPAPDLGADTLLCEGNTLVLQSNGQQGSVLLWQDGSSGGSFTVSSPGVYSLTETNHCGAGSDDIAVTYNAPPPVFDLGPDTVLCSGESIILTAPVTNAQITWQDGSNGASIVADQQQVYSLTLTNLCGQSDDDITLTIDARQPVIDVGEKISWCKDEVITLDVTQTFNAIYSWSNGSTSPIIDIYSPGQYAVSVAAPCATASQQIEVTEGIDCDYHDDVFIPDVFSPNNDQRNDDFLISFGPDLLLTGATLEVYDRWGSLMYSTKDLPLAWNGKYHDQFVNPGVYLWTLKYGFSKGGRLDEEFLAGSVTVVK